MASGPPSWGNTRYWDGESWTAAVTRNGYQIEESEAPRIVDPPVGSSLAEYRAKTERWARVGRWIVVGVIAVFVVATALRLLIPWIAERVEKEVDTTALAECLRSEGWTVEESGAVGIAGRGGATQAWRLATPGESSAVLAVFSEESEAEAFASQEEVAVNDWLDEWFADVSGAEFAFGHHRNIGFYIEDQRVAGVHGDQITECVEASYG